MTEQQILSEVEVKTTSNTTPNPDEKPAETPGAETPGAETIPVKVDGNPTQ